MLRIFIPTLALLIPLTAGEIRTWTNPDGSKTFKAEFIRRDKGTVTLRPIGGRELSMGMEKLHADDQSWLKKNHPTEGEAKASEVPDMAALFDTLKFGDKRETVTAKLKASKMVEANLDSTFFGRTGINGIYRTVQPIGGLDCYLFFDWDEADLLKEITLRTEDKVVFCRLYEDLKDADAAYAMAFQSLSENEPNDRPVEIEAYMLMYNTPAFLKLKEGKA